MSLPTAPLVSCIVPVYNGERFLADAVTSILNQSYARVEAIVVDDGSTDTTPEVIAGFGSQLRAIRQANAGPGAARNRGIAIAKGTFLAFLDADDIWYPDKLARQMGRFQERPELEISFAQVRNVPAFPDQPGSPPFDASHWPAIPFSPCTLLARREAFERVGLYDPMLRRGEDTEWNVRMMMRGICYEVLPDVLLQRRIHDQNLTLQQVPSPEDVLTSLKSALDRRRTEGW